MPVSKSAHAGTTRHTIDSTRLEQIEKIWAERESPDNLRLLLDQPLYIIMLNPAMGVRLH